MPVFTYRALTPGGERTHGEIDAVDERAAIQALQAQGLLPIEASPETASFLSKPILAGSGRAKRASSALTVFTRELATLLRAGEPLERAMAMIAEDTGDKSLSAALRRVVTAVRGGQSLARAIDAEAQFFPRVYVGMVGAGEATGRLHQALDEVADLQERQELARRKLIASLTYPIVLCIVALASVAFMLALVVPNFAPLLEGHEHKLPATTLFVLAASSAIRSYGYAIAIGLALLVLGAIALSRIGPLRQAFDRMVMNAGWLGRMPKERVTAQLARALGTLLKGGLDLPASLTMSAEMVDNSAARASLTQIRSEVRQGSRLADALQRQQILAPMGLRLIRTGEESGRLGELCSYLADQMDRRLEDRTSRLLTLMEPILVVVLGIVVGGITVSILSHAHGQRTGILTTADNRNSVGIGNGVVTALRYCVDCLSPVSLMAKNFKQN